MVIFPLFFLFLSPQLSPEPYQLEELNPFMLYSSSTYEHRSLIVYGELKNRPIIRLFLYDFKNNNGFFIEDGRLDGFRPLFIAASSHGWFLWESSSFRPPRVAHLKHDGEFIDFVSLEKISGWEQGLSVRSAYGYNQNHTLLTLEKYALDQPNTLEMRLATLNLETLELHTILTQSETGPGLRWVPFSEEERFLQINTFNGSIKLTDAQGKILKTLQKESSVHSKTLNNSLIAKSREISSLPAALKLKKSLHFIINHKNTVSCRHNTYDSDGDFAKSISLNIDHTGKIDTSTPLLLSYYKGKEIRYNKEDRLIFLKETPYPIQEE